MKQYFLLANQLGKFALEKAGKVLECSGSGSFRLTGGWEYQGEDPNPPAMRQVVARQTQLELHRFDYRDRLTALDGSNMGLSLTNTKAKHLVRQY